MQLEGYKQISPFYLCPTTDYILDSMMACKELAFFHVNLFFPCLPFALNFFFQDINTGQGEAQTKTANKNICERNSKVFQVIRLSTYQGNQGENPAAFLPPRYIFIGKQWAQFKDRLIELRVLLQNFPTTLCTTGCQRAC